MKELLSRSLALETKYYRGCSGDEVFPEDCPLAITNSRTEFLGLEHFGVEPRDEPLEACQLLARIATLETSTHFELRLLALELRFGLKYTGYGIISRIEALDKKVFGYFPSQPPLMRIAATRLSFKSPLSGYEGSAALRRKAYRSAGGSN
jgi:hypothetical protein